MKHLTLLFFLALTSFYCTAQNCSTQYFPNSRVDSSYGPYCLDWQYIQKSKDSTYTYSYQHDTVIYTTTTRKSFFGRLFGRKQNTSPKTILTPFHDTTVTTKVNYTDSAQVILNCWRYTTVSFTDSIVTCQSLRAPYFGLAASSKPEIPNYPSIVDPFKPYKVKLHRIDNAWGDINPSPGVYNWDKLNKAITDCANAGIYVDLVFHTGDLAPQWVFDAAGSFMTSGGNRNGPWPKYLTQQYRTLYYDWTKKIQDHIASLPINLKSKVASVIIYGGSTGDNDPYKGTPVNTIDRITDTQWEVEMKRNWDTIIAHNYRMRYDTLFSLGFNQGNEFEFYQYLLNKTRHLSKRIHMKHGDASHFYNFDGAALTIGQQDTTIFFGEMQFPMPGNVTQKHKEGRVMAWQALHKDFKLMQITTQWRTQMRETGETLTTDWILEPVNRYMEDMTLCFSVPSGIINYDDLTQYPESQYGSLVLSSELSTYNNKINSINNDNSIPEETKTIYRYKVLRDHINIARVNALLAANPGAGYSPPSYTTDPNYSNFINDIALNGIVNFERGMHIKNYYTTTTSLRKVGPDTSMWGRGAYKFNSEVGYDVDTYNNADTVTLTVHYLDIGAGSFNINFNNGVGNNIPLTNTGLFKEAKATGKIIINTTAEIVLTTNKPDGVIIGGVELKRGK